MPPFLSPPLFVFAALLVAILFSCVSSRFYSRVPSVNLNPSPPCCCPFYAFNPRFQAATHTALARFPCACWQSPDVLDCLTFFFPLHRRLFSRLAFGFFFSTPISLPPEVKRVPTTPFVRTFPISFLHSTCFFLPPLYSTKGSPFLDSKRAILLVASFQLARPCSPDWIACQRGF